MQLPRESKTTAEARQNNCPGVVKLLPKAMRQSKVPPPPPETTTKELPKADKTTAQGLKHNCRKKLGSWAVDRFPPPPPLLL